jgi:hypothetical protein
MTGMVKLAGLTARVSKFGTEYLVGYLGDVKVVVCEIRERQDGDTETHAIYLAPVTQQSAPQAPQQATPEPAPKPAPRKAAPKRTAPKRDTRKPQPDTTISVDWQKPLDQTGYDWSVGDRLTI